jgi:hypothetical protein
MISQETLDELNKKASPKMIKLVEDYFSKPVVCTFQSLEESEEEGWHPVGSGRKRKSMDE